MVPAFEIRYYRNQDVLPKEVEEMFREEIAESRKKLPDSRSEKGKGNWNFFNVSAIAADNRVVGGAHFDIGPMNFGPLGNERIAFLEQIVVRPEYRKKGVATEVLSKGLDALKNEGIYCVQCSADWDNAGEIALYKKCGFAMVDVSDQEEGGEYIALRPLHV